MCLNLFSLVIVSDNLGTVILCDRFGVPQTDFGPGC